MKATVIKAGALVTVQDLGRTGQGRRGLSPAGAMDRKALLWANRLLGNPPDAPCLEVALGGLELLFDSDVTCALAGADSLAKLDGAPVGSWRTVRIAAGGRLKLGYARDGVYTYLAVPGGLQTPHFAGSASMVDREGLGFRPLTTGSELSWHGERAASGLVPAEFHLRPLEQYGFIPGYEWLRFSHRDREAFLSAAWQITPESNRVATRLEGPALESGPRVLDSVPLVDGAVQVLPSGRPLVFMRDRPTIGGYARLGSVAPTDLDALAQSRPGTRVRFQVVDPEAVRRAALRQAGFFGL